MSNPKGLSAKLQGLGRVAGRSSILLALVAMGVWAVACHNDKTPTQPQHEHAVSVVNLDRATLTLATGEQATLSAAPTCTCGEVLPAAVTWASSDEAVATVADGVVTGVSFGTATITATAEGKNASVAVEVTALGTVIGPAGGTVTSADGNVTLEIPAGALTAETDVTIVPADETQLPADPPFIAGTGYDVQPAGLQLQQQARLQIHYDSAQVPDSVNHDRLRIRERDRQQDQWRDCDNTGLQQQEQAVQAWMERFGTYAIVVQPPAGTVIGALGGTVVSSDGNVELTIPAGALDEPTDIVVTKVDDAEFADEPLYVNGTAYDMQPDGLQFNAPASLRIHFDSANVPSGASYQQLRIQQHDQTQNRWRGADHVAVVQDVVEAHIEHFSVYAILASAPPSAVVAAVSVSPSVASVEEGDVIQLSATVTDSDGNVLDVPVTWSTSNPGVATVSGSGLLTAHATGSVTVTASAGGKQGSSNVSVTGKIASITITGETSVSVGATTQLTATAYTSTGGVVSTSFTWASSNAAVATVNGSGLVTGVAEGTSNVSASAKSTSASVVVTVSTTGGGGGGGGDDGGGEETSGNNLSWPVVFAEGTGVTGSPVSTDPGVRPTTAETDAAAELAAIEFTSPSAAFWWSGNTVDASGYYVQGTTSTWRAQIIDGTGQPKYDAEAGWGDNLAGSASLKAGHPIRVEVALSATGVGTLQGYSMPYAVNESSPDEIQGTDGTLIDQVPLIYTVAPILTIEQLSGPGGSVIGTVSDGVITSEVNVGGRLVYGGQFKPTEAGTYRLRFRLASGANVSITSAVNGIVVSANESSIEVTVQP